MADTTAPSRAQTPLRHALCHRPVTMNDLNLPRTTRPHLRPYSSHHGVWVAARHTRIWIPSPKIHIYLIAGTHGTAVNPGILRQAFPAPQTLSRIWLGQAAGRSDAATRNHDSLRTLPVLCPQSEYFLHPGPSRLLEVPHRLGLPQGRHLVHIPRPPPV